MKFRTSFYIILSIIMFLLSSVSCVARGLHVFTLVIDPGHGGHDAGAVGSFSQEKDINLNVALTFGKMVEQRLPNVKVVYTRKTDVFIPLQERANIANKCKADLFISIHTNSLPEGRIAYGAETYTLGMARAGTNLDVAKRENSVILYESDYKQKYSGFNPNSAESYIMFEFMQDQYMKKSVDLASCIQNSYVQIANRKDKGVHQSGFLVLRNTSMPSVLTELGFISTPEEENYLNSQEGIATMGQCIFDGFATYLRKIDKLSPKIDKSQLQISKRNFYADLNSDQSTDEPVSKKDMTDIVKVETDSDALNELSKKEAGTSQTSALSSKGVSMSVTNPKIQQPKIETKVAVPTKKVVPTTIANIKKEDVKVVSKAKPTNTVSKVPVVNKPNKVQMVSNANTSSAAKDGKVVYKIQIFAVSKRIPLGSSRFKELENVDCYEENNMIKYTYGSEENYSEILKLKKSISEKFPEAFVVAFLDNEKIELSKALQLSRKK